MEHNVLINPEPAKDTSAENASSSPESNPTPVEKFDAPNDVEEIQDLANVPRLTLVRQYAHYSPSP